MIERTNVPGLSPPPGYSHAVVASGRRFVTTAGAVPLDPQGNLVGLGDCVTQARQALDNLALALGAVGAKGSNVLRDYGVRSLGGQGGPGRRVAGSSRV